MIIKRQREILDIRQEEEKKEREIRIKKHFDKKNLFLCLVAAIKKKDEIIIAEIISKVPKHKIGDFIWKLGSYKYKGIPHAALAIHKLRGRKGF